MNLSKGLDQYLLVDERFLNEEVLLLDLSCNDVVLEIGPGTGNLTRKLAERARVIAIEKDERFSLHLNIPNVELIFADALKIDFDALEFNKFASNIPYSVSREIILKLLRTEFDRGVIVCQDEFARKLVARPRDKNYRAISVIAQYYADLELHSKVPRTAFRPVPDVDSRIVSFVKKRARNIDFENFVKSAFSQRRKIFWKGKRPGEMSVEEFEDAFSFGK